MMLVIRVYDDVRVVIEIHEHHGDSKSGDAENVSGYGVSLPTWSEGCSTSVKVFERLFRGEQPPLTRTGAGDGKFLNQEVG